MKKAMVARGGLVIVMEVKGTRRNGEGELSEVKSMTDMVDKDWKIKRWKELC